MGSRPSGDEVVVTVPRSEVRRRELRMVAVFVVAAVPVAIVVTLILNLAIAVVYVVGQTLFLWLGFRRRSDPVLRLRATGLSYEPGRFQVRCDWSDVDAVGKIDLPGHGSVEAFLLTGPHLHWCADDSIRREAIARSWDRAIPLGLFEAEWEWGEIGAAVRAWAPWIFELPDADQP